MLPRTENIFENVNNILSFWIYCRKKEKIILDGITSRIESVYAVSNFLVGSLENAFSIW